MTAALFAGEPMTCLEMLPAVLGITFGVPAAVFVMGYALGGAFSGFRKSP